MKVKDLMTKMDMENYLAEILKIPLAEDGPNRNRSKNGGNSCYETNRFGKYRSLCQRQNILKRKIEEQTAEIFRTRSLYGECPLLHRQQHKLRELILELGSTRLKARSLEEKCENIPELFLREIVRHRYFEDVERRLPTWTETAKELGIAVTGEELRRYVTSRLGAG